MNITNENISQLQDITKQAGEKILEIYNDASLSQVVDYKSDNSPLTLADKASNEVIVHSLQQIFPNIPIVSEENKKIPFETRKSYQYFWLVDPLDGTKEFIKRNGEFTVNIALVHETRPVFGIIYVPVQQITYWGTLGQGSYKQQQQQQQVAQLKVAKFRESDSDLQIVCSRSHLNPETEEFLQKFQNPQTTSMGSSLKFMLVAEGSAHIYPRLAPTMEWDTAAAQIIVEEAGGKVVSHPSAEPLQYRKPDLRNGEFIVYGEVV